MGDVPVDRIALFDSFGYIDYFGYFVLMAEPLGAIRRIACLESKTAILDTFAE